MKWKIQKFFALMLFTLVPALALFALLLMFDVDWVFATLAGLAYFGFGIDVCVFGNKE